MAKYFDDVSIKFDQESDNYLKLVAEPFERGYATTIGNTLRRTLLTSIPGAAVTSLRIDGVSHEFSTIPGVVEDVTDIVLNLKKLRFRLIEGFEGPNLQFPGIASKCYHLCFKTMLQMQKEQTTRVNKGAQSI